MQRWVAVALVLVLFAAVLHSCAKYKSAKGYADPRLTNPYCNDPSAVNYNWGFPGKPDSSVCFYPTDVFAGRYLFHDSIALASNDLPIMADSFIITIHKLSSTKMSVFGLCTNGDSIIMTATQNFTATVDTLIGDSVTNQGQYLCGAKDTLNGTITENRIDSVLTISFTVAADSGVTTLHAGSARLIR